MATALPAVAVLVCMLSRYVVDAEGLPPGSPILTTTISGALFRDLGAQGSGRLTTKTAGEPQARPLCRAGDGWPPVGPHGICCPLQAIAPQGFWANCCGCRCVSAPLAPYVSRSQAPHGGYRPLTHSA